MLLLRHIQTAFPLWLSMNCFAAATATSLNSTRTPISESSSLGINCRGNFWCPWLPTSSNLILQYLLDWIDTEVDDEDLYTHRQHIACATLYADRRGRGSAFCVFTKGHNLAPPGIKGAVIKKKLSELRAHGCFACGSVPLGDDNDPDTSGMLTLNYVLKPQCSTLSRQESPICPPHIPAPAQSTDSQPSGTPPAFQIFNLTSMDSAVQLATLQTG